VKLNSSDQREGGLGGDDALQVVDALDSSSVDLIDISGGTYFPGVTSTTMKREMMPEQKSGRATSTVRAVHGRSEGGKNFCHLALCRGFADKGCIKSEMSHARTNLQASQDGHVVGNRQDP
tara:strand:- start:68 stop:430 length:363 start_codon:yes stop_codon:yes gene_type:complete